MSEAKNAEAELAELIAREMCKYRGEDPDDSAPEEYIRDSERPTSMWQMFSSETGLIARALLSAGYAKREDVLWAAIGSAPLGEPILVRMRIRDFYWVATARLKHVSEEDGFEPWVEADLLHYNGDILYAGFRGPFERWRPVDRTQLKGQP